MEQLFYVIGASGAGKDSLMNYARSAINGSRPVLFAHRYITRPSGGNENHISVSPEEFQSRLKGGLFALHWDSHGQQYGIGNEIDDYMERGFAVVVNGSRQYLEQARERYPQLHVIMIEASPETIRQRLLGRRRETADDIERRIARNLTIGQLQGPVISISNNGPLAEAGEILVQRLVAATYAGGAI